MSPRNTAAGALKTRATIVDHAMAVASVRGLDGLTLGELASDLGLSKAGVIGPFGSKEQLQLEVLNRQAELFLDCVWRPVAELPAGLPRLAAAVRAWISYLERCPLPGGCLTTTASVEFDAREGAVHDRAASLVSGWNAQLAADAAIAVRSGDLPADADPQQIAFEIYGIALALNQAVVLLADSTAPARARAAATRLLAGGLSR